MNLLNKFTKNRQPPTANDCGPKAPASSLTPSAWFFWGQIALGGALFLALGHFLWPTLTTLGRRLAGNDNYSFGLLIPLVIAYIVYRKWPELRRPWQPSWLGLGVMALGFGGFLFSELVAIPYFAHLSCVLLLGGVLCLLGGGRLVRTLSFPLFLLVITIPLPQFFISRMTLRMQLVSSQLGAEMLRLMGYAVHLQGNILDLGERKLEIVAACSGLSYLFTALGLAVIFCYFFQRRPWKVMLLLFAMLPFAIVANASRLAGIGIYPALETGFWHAAFGLSVFIVGFDYLKMNNWVLNYLKPEPPASPPPTSPPVKTTSPGDASRISYYPYLCAGLALALLAGPLSLRVAEVQPVPLVQSFDRFPLALGPWQGRHVPIDPELVQATGADAFLNTAFLDPDQGRVSLWIAYYENQQSGQSVHSPLSCIPGSGWKVEQREVFAAAPGKPINYVLFNNGEGRMAVYYWYLERGRWLASDYWHKLSIGLDRLTRRRADGALVRLDTTVEGDPRLARQRLDGFLEQLAPVLPQFIQE
jgi:exosortase D (VPLPA-CTERM-specific)